LESTIRRAASRREWKIRSNDLSGKGPKSTFNKWQAREEQHLYFRTELGLPADITSMLTEYYKIREKTKRRTLKCPTADWIQIHSSRYKLQNKVGHFFHAKGI
jgi:hypothetical protein